MQPLVINPDTLRRVAAAQGIDTVRSLAERSGVSEWPLYKALNKDSRFHGRLMPSHVEALKRTLGTDEFVVHEDQPEPAA